MGLFGILGGLSGLFGGGAGSAINTGASLAQNAAVQQASNRLMTEESQDQVESLNQYTQLTKVQSDYNRKQRTATTVATMAEQEDSLMLSIQGAVNTLTKTATDMVKNG
jgi:hypothetical protein